MFEDVIDGSDNLDKCFRAVLEWSRTSSILINNGTITTDHAPEYGQMLAYLTWFKYFFYRNDVPRDELTRPLDEPLPLLNFGFLYNLIHSKFMNNEEVHKFVGGTFLDLDRTLKNPDITDGFGTENRGGDAEVYDPHRIYNLISEEAIIQGEYPLEEGVSE